MNRLNRYAVVIDTYVYAQGDKEAKKLAHDIKRKIKGDLVWTENDDLPF